MFTDDEVDAAVRRYLSTDVEHTRTKTGSRDIVGAKEQVYDLVTTTLLLEPDAYYYVIWLASNKLAGLLAEQIADMTVIAEAAPNASRPAKLLGPATELVNAEAAIVDLNAAFNSRTSGVSGALGPAVERFRTSVERYIKTELVKNVVVSGDVAETGDELKAKILETWLRAKERHVEINDLTLSLYNALQIFRSVRLPDSAIKKIVSRIQAKIQDLQLVLTGTTAVRDSREAMLDLLAMRTLLQRCSSFRAPATALAPLNGDSSTGTLVNSSGDRASVLGDMSAPYTYELLTDLDLTVNGGTPVSVAFPDSSRARVDTSVTLSFPAPAGMQVAVLRDGTTTVTATSVAWASGAAAATALDAALAGIDVAWNGVTGCLEFRSQLATDGSQLAFLDGTPDRTDFLAWAFGGALPLGYSTPLPAEDLRLLFPPSVVAAVESTVYGTFFGVRSAVGGEEDVLWNRLASGADLVSDGTVTVSAGVDLEARGVLPGMWVEITAPTAMTRQIVAVDGPDLELSSAVPAATNTYYVGPDYTEVPVNARVAMTGSSVANRGYWRVVSGGVAKLTLDRDIPVADTAISSTVFTDYLRLSARGTTTSSGLGVTAGAGATAIGLAATAELPASLSVLQVSIVDFNARGVSDDDLLHLVAPSGDEFDAVITAVEPSALTFTPAVPYEAGSWIYEVTSVSGAAYDDFRDVTEGFLENVSATAAPVETVVLRLVRGARYSSELSGTINDYLGSLDALLDATAAYQIPRDTTVDQVVRAFQEQGFDRALDLFIGLELTELFSMSSDGVSYSSWLLRKSADVAREVMPITKDPRDVNNQWRTLSTQSNSFDPRSEPEIK